MVISVAEACEWIFNAFVLRAQDYDNANAQQLTRACKTIFKFTMCFQCLTTEFPVNNSCCSIYALVNLEARLKMWKIRKARCV